MNPAKGQKQDGVDIISQKSKIAIQCKLVTEILSSKDIDLELSKFKKGKFWNCNENDKYRTYIFAVSHDRDTHTQNYIGSLSSSKLAVEIIFWPEIQSQITSNTQLLKKFYPELYEQKTSLKLSDNDKDSTVKLIGALHGNPNHSEQASLFITENAYITSCFTEVFINNLSGIINSSIFFQDEQLEKIRKSLFHHLQNFTKQFHSHYSNNGTGSYFRISHSSGDYLKDREIAIKISDDLLSAAEPVRLAFNKLLRITA